MLAPYFIKPPACDIDRIWIISYEFSEGHKTPHYAWTTLRMMRCVHWWLRANNQVIDDVGKLFITFDGDHDVIRTKLNEIQRNNRTVRMKFDSAEHTPVINAELVRIEAGQADLGLPSGSSASSSAVPKKILRKRTLKERQVLSGR